MPWQIPFSPPSSKELSWLKFRFGRIFIQKKVPVSFIKYYPHYSIMIDCSEIFIKRPSSLDATIMGWSNYKHHSTIIYLTGITSNGTISFIPDSYGGRVTNISIVNYI